MSRPNEQFRKAWLWVTGLACLALPFLWWPKPIGFATVIHIVFFVTALWWVIREGRRGGFFDGDRAHWRGYAGVVAFSAVFFGAVAFYRAVIL